MFRLKKLHCCRSRSKRSQRSCWLRCTTWSGCRSIQLHRWMLVMSKWLSTKTRPPCCPPSCRSPRSSQSRNSPQSGSSSSSCSSACRSASLKFLVKIKYFFFWILWSWKYIFLIIQINNSRGDLSDISAKTSSPVCLLPNLLQMFQSVHPDVIYIYETNNVEGRLLFWDTKYTLDDQGR